MGNFVLVCVGGALGSGARYLVATWAAHEGAITYAVLNLAVTVLGCLATGTLGLFSARLIARVGSGLAT